MDTRTDTPSAVKAAPIPETPRAQPMVVRDHRASAGAVERVEDARQQEVKASGMVAALLEAARDPRTDVVKVEKLYAIHRELVAEQRREAFLDALARVQGQVEPVRRNLDNTHTQSKYADLAALFKAVMHVAAGEGLSLTFNTAPSPIEGHIRVIGTLSHRNGHEKDYHRDVPLDKAGSQGKVNKTDIQAQDSSITYAKRSLTKMIFALAETGDDKDGNATDRKKKTITKEQLGELATLLNGLIPTGIEENKYGPARALVEKQLVEALEPTWGITKLEDLPAEAFKHTVDLVARRKAKMDEKMAAK